MVRKPNAIFAFSNASFCHNSKGYSPSLKGNLIKSRWENIHEACVIMVPEYNASQVWSGCHLVQAASGQTPRKIVG